MNAMKMTIVACSAVVCGALTAAESESEAEKSGFSLSDYVAVEAGVALDSRYMSYGVIDGKDPIVTPSAQVTLFDYVYFGVSAIYDVTKANGKRGGYGNRAGQWTTLDATVGVAHDFELCESLGALSVDFNYIYEYLRRYHSDMGDTQYLNLEFSLGDLWLEPTLAIERDLMADDGTYVNFSIGHEFSIIDGANEDDLPVLAFRPSIGQGIGNSQRAAGYFVKRKGSEEALDHGGLMDTTIMGELTWNICENISLTGYVAYSDYLLDGNMRDGARAHNADWGGACDRSWNVYGGVALGVSF